MIAANGRRLGAERGVDGDERLRCTRVSGGLSMDILAVRNSYDENQQLIVGN